MSTSNDPLSTIYKEIAHKQEKYGKEIESLETKKRQYLNDIKEININKEKSIEELKTQHKKDVNELTEKYANIKKHFQTQFDEITNKTHNKSLADSVIIQSRFDEEKNCIRDQIDKINLDLKLFIENKNRVNHILMLPFQDSVEFDKNTLREITTELNNMKDSKLVVNKVDKCRKGPKKTKADSKIAEKEGEIEETKIIFDIRADKLEKRYQINKELYFHQIKKLKKMVNQKKLTNADSHSKLEEMKKMFKVQITNLNMQLLSLTEPKPFPRPRKKVDRSQEIQRKCNSSNELQALLRSKTDQLTKLKDANHNLILQIRKLNWVLSNPTDVTYTRSSILMPGVEG